MSTTRNTHTARTALAVLGCGLAGMLALAGPASAGPSGTEATAAISGGSLTMVAPASVAFGATLTGAEQTVRATQQLDVFNQSGSDAGWSLTATSTTFKAGGKSLPDSAISVPSAPTVTCDVADTCVAAVTDVAYPYALPAGTVAPPATKLFNAVASSGLGNQTAEATMALTIPAAASPGAYTSTWTYSLVSSP